MCCERRKDNVHTLTIQPSSHITPYTHSFGTLPVVFSLLPIMPVDMNKEPVKGRPCDKAYLCSFPVLLRFKPLTPASMCRCAYCTADSGSSFAL